MIASHASVAVLFARRDSIYKSIASCDVWDADRDALNWRGGMPAIMHPPCRAWGRLKHMANPRAGERELALWSVCMVRIWGGIIEHPAASALWPAALLPEPGERDAWGGFTFAAPQMWWGHKAEKATRFYVVGCEPKELPSTPFVMGEASHVIAQSNRRQRLRLKPEVSKADRERTPPALATWLVELAQKCRPQTKP